MGREQFSFLIGLVVLLLVGVVVWMNWRYQIVFPREQNEGFEAGSTADPAQTAMTRGSTAAPMVRTVLTPYMDPRFCTLFTKMRTSIVAANSSTGSPTDPEAVEKTTTQLALEIPGGPAPCPLSPLPPDSAEDKVWLEYVNALPRDLFARILFTAQYMNRTLHEKEKEIGGATAGNQASTEGFQPLCSPSVADTRRAELQRRGLATASAAEAASCVNPEELTPEQLRNQIQLILQEIQSTSAAAFTKAGSTSPLTPSLLAPLLDDSERILQKLDGIKQQAESNTLPLPKAG